MNNYLIHNGKLWKATLIEPNLIYYNNLGDWEIFEFEGGKQVHGSMCQNMIACFKTAATEALGYRIKTVKTIHGTFRIGDRIKLQNSLYTGDHLFKIDEFILAPDFNLTFRLANSSHPPMDITEARSCYIEVSVEELAEIQARLDAINNRSRTLEELRITKEGKIIDITERAMSEFLRTGLNNTDFIRMQLWNEYTGKFLFKDEYGNDIYENDQIACVLTKGSWEIKSNLRAHQCTSMPAWKKFKYYDDAATYLRDYKPVYSRKEVNEMIAAAKNTNQK